MARIAFFVAFLIAASAAYPQPVSARFPGSFEITAKAGTCPKYNPVGQHGIARFRPEVPKTNNGPGASFVWIGERTAKGFRLASGNFAAALKAAQTVYVDDEWAPSTGAVRARFSQVVSDPTGAISPQTRAVRIVGQIVGFDQMPACNVTFKMALSKFVDAVAGGNPTRGKSIAVQCQACHDLTKGGPHLTGPNLWGVVDRPIASASGYSYSAALVTFASGKSWIYDELDLWLTSPLARVPGTKMTFAGLPKAQDRADVVAYLRTLADTPAPLTLK